LEEAKEPKPVALSDAVTDPRAVVVMRGNAMITCFTVLATERLLNVADGAVLILYVQLNFFIVHVFQIVL
jgi:hypothetical protein